MTPQEKQEFNKMKDDLLQLQSLFFVGDFPDKKVFYKKLVADGGLDLTGDNITLGNSSSVIGLYGVTPVVKASAITSPTGGGTVDSQSRTAINSIITAIKDIGITA